MGRTLRAREESIAVGAAAIILGVVVLPPLAVVLVDALRSSTGAFALVASSNGIALLFTSLRIALAVTAVALLIGVPLGVLCGRFDVAGRRAAWALHAFSLAVSPFLLALGWFHLLGERGVFGNVGTARTLFAEPGVVVVLALALSPIVTSLTALAVRGIDESLVDAARVSAGSWRVVSRVLVPVCAPAIGLGAIVVFALAFSELGVPMFLRVPVYPAAVMARLSGADYAPGEAAALSLPLVVVALVLFSAERRLARARAFAAMGLRGGGRTPLALGRLRRPISIAVWCIALVGSAPLVGLALRAEPARAAPWLGSAPLNTIVTASIAATVVLGIGVVLGHRLARDVAGARTLDGIAALAFVMPAAILGVGIIAVWNRATTQVVYASSAIVVMGFVARHAVVGMRACAATFVASPPALEDAARVFGASYGLRATRILLPIHGRSLVGVWLLVFVLCARDLETAILFYPPGGEPLTVRIFTLEANGPEGVVAALALGQVTIAALAAGAGAFLLARSDARR